MKRKNSIAASPNKPAFVTKSQNSPNLGLFFDYLKPVLKPGDEYLWGTVSNNPQGEKS
jgi:hypothetical protein